MFRISDKDKQTALTFIETFGGQVDLYGQAVVFFEKPHGDGYGVRSWTGGLIDSSMALAEFTMGLYASGGRVVLVEMKAGGRAESLSGSDWERSTGVLEAAAEARAKASIS